MDMSNEDTKLTQPLLVSPFMAFEKEAGQATHGLAMVFDLEGFSQFFNQPDVQLYVSKYLNHILNAMDILVRGEKSIGVTKKEK